MKICLINPPHEGSLDPVLDPPLGLLYIAAVLKKSGYNIHVVDLSFHDKIVWKDVIPYADIYGITVMTASFHNAISIRNIVKNISPKCKVMVGGAHPSSLPEETANEFDIVVIGEGEGIVNDIVKYVKNPNSVFPKIFNGNKKLTDIDRIPLPERDLVDITRYTRLVDGKRALSIITSRGCPYLCAFCINSGKNASKVRFRSVGLVINELKYIINNYSIKNFIFYDDTFTINPQLGILLEEIKKLDIIFRCNGNTRRDNLDTFTKLYDAGCREIDFGIESGSQEVLDIINKRTTIEQNKYAISSAKRAGLQVKAFLMVGSPGESWETVEKTIKFMQDTRPQLWTLFNFVALPGCDIWNNPNKYGIKIVSKDYRQYFNIAGNNIGGLVCETKYMTIEEIEKARQYMIKNFPKQTGPLQEYHTKLGDR